MWPPAASFYFFIYSFFLFSKLFELNQLRTVRHVAAIHLFKPRPAAKTYHLTSAVLAYRTLLDPPGHECAVRRTAAVLICASAPALPTAYRLASAVLSSRALVELTKSLFCNCHTRSQTAYYLASTGPSSLRICSLLAWQSRASSASRISETHENNY